MQHCKLLNVLEHSNKICASSRILILVSANVLLECFWIERRNTGIIVTYCASLIIFAGI